MRERVKEGQRESKRIERESRYVWVCMYVCVSGGVCARVGVGEGVGVGVGGPKLIDQIVFKRRVRKLGCVLDSL